LPRTPGAFIDLKPGDEIELPPVVMIVAQREFQPVAFAQWKQDLPEGRPSAVAVAGVTVGDDLWRLKFHQPQAGLRPAPGIEHVCADGPLYRRIVQ